MSAILALSARQHDLVTLAQLLDAGLSRRGIQYRARTGRLHRIHPTVFAVGRPTLTREGRWMAAVLACGAGAALSHVSAGQLWAIYEGVAPRWPHVSVPTNNGRRGQPAIKLHRARTLDAENDITQRNGIPVTDLRRTLLDLTQSLDAKRLKSAIRHAERRHGLDLQQMSHSLDALPASSPVAAKLKRTLATYLPGTATTEGEPEAEFLDLCHAHGIPRPTPQYTIGPYRADFAWPDLKLVVEIDDRGSHDTLVAFLDDRRRDRFMKAQGFEVLRFAVHELRHEPHSVARELREGIARRQGVTAR